ncbi:MAG TPA: class I SAM-dependent DNA methyltransferase, partial [Campylobacterales bacterium]|nr:class I SAM-dependent DNA methyltransferase [Campylobacterales bacterium]
MNKSALKKFATSIRNELKRSISTKLDYLLGLGSNLPIELKDEEQNIEIIRKRCTTDGKLDDQKRDELIEEVAYTWFNRLIALRFMDANGITESGVVSPIKGQTLPEIFNLAKGGDISDKLNLDRDKFYDLCDGKIPSNNPDNEAYRMLFISVCNYYSEIMPFMFETIKDYTELLLPDDMLSSNSIRAKVVEALDDESLKDVEIVGWLYQFYISEKKDEVFNKLKKNVKITPQNIPAATQLFTPHWIVKYM